MPLTKIDLTEQVQNDLPAVQVATSADRQFLTTEEKAAATRSATAAQTGLMTAAQASKLDGVGDNANNYTHPASHPASMITPDSTHRFVTDTEKSTWNGKLGGSGQQTLSGDLTVTGDLTIQGTTVKMDTETIEVEDNLILLNKNQVGNPSPTLKSGIEIERGDKENARMIFDEADEKWKTSKDGGTSHQPFALESDSRFLTTAEKAAATRNATSGQEGLMSAAQAGKLDEIEANANDYSLPAATAAVRGGIKVGSNLNVSGDVLSVPDATTSVKGALQVGSNLSVSGGVVSAPNATTSVKGVVKVGSNISVASGTISVADGSTSVKGALSVGSNIDVASGVISVADADGTKKGVAKAIQTERLTADGSSNKITLTYAFSASTYMAVYRNGLRQWEGASDDYTRSTGTKEVVFVNMPKSGDKIIVDYIPQ